MKNIFRNIVIAGIIIAFAGCNNNTGKTTVQKKETSNMDAIKIETYSASFQDVPQNEVYSSTIQAYAVNNIAPISGSRIQKINVEIGDFVNKGQILAEMDKVQLNQARLKLTNDSTEFIRTKGLYKEGGISKSNYESMELSMKVSKSSYQNLYENTILRSPVSGVITARNYDKGDLFTMGRPIYVVQQISPVKLLVGISESDYTAIAKGKQVNITVDALPDTTFKGTVNRIYPTIDATTHTFLTEIIVGNNDRKLRPGMYAKVMITFGINHSITLPDEAVVKMQGSGQRHVFVLQPDNTVKSCPVTLGRHFGNYYEILEGVAEGDIVATKGSSSLKNGSMVEVVNN